MGNSDGKKEKKTQKKHTKKLLSNAVAMINMEENIIWQTFYSLLTANIFIISVAVFFDKLFPKLSNFSIIPNLIGLIVCILWFLMTNRHFSYQKYWFAWARKYEKDLAKPKEQMINIGSLYSKGNVIKVDAQEIQMNWFGRLFKVKYLIMVMIFFFAFLHIVVIYNRMVLEP